jgi:hypothetical protein
MISFSLTEVQWFRIHGGFGRLDDPRQPGRAPSDRIRAAGVFSYPSVLEQEHASFEASPEVISWHT